MRTLSADRPIKGSPLNKNVLDVSSRLNKITKNGLFCVLGFVFNFKQNLISVIYSIWHDFP